MLDAIKDFSVGWVNVRVAWDRWVGMGAIPP